MTTTPLAPARRVLSRYVVMGVLGLAGTVIYLLPFLREIYYEPLRLALGLTNSQTGVLMAVFGFTSMIAYIPGGWIADRVEPRRLIAASLVSTGLLGFYFATFPSYLVAIVIHALWGLTVTGMMWGAMIKATREWASGEEQGKAFGLLEAGRGVFEAAFLSIFLAIFARLGGDAPAFAAIIVQYSVLHVVLGVVAYFLITPGMGDRSETSASLADILRVLRMRQVWLIAIVVLAGYSAYWGAYYFTPYASDVFMMSAVLAGAIGAGKVWLKPFAAVAAGLIADRIGISKAVAYCFYVLIASFAAFAVLPGGASMIPFMLGNVAIASLAIFALRGIYFALLEEGGVPIAVTGTAAGVVSMLGFTPDIFMPLVGGVLLDAFPGGAGYKFYFAFIALLCGCGAAATLAIKRTAKPVTAAA